MAANGLLLNGNKRTETEEWVKFGTRSATVRRVIVDFSVNNQQPESLSVEFSCSDENFMFMVTW